MPSWVAIACWTRVIKVILADSRSRASHSMTGTPWLTDSASWTLMAVCENSPWNPLMPTMNGRPAASKKSTAGKDSASRRVSTSTTAPMAPWMRSSHMNQKRCCPGVPNRYRISPASRLTRPKSMATVVVVFSGTLARSSTPPLAAVSNASVVSGVISETDPTKVVLPTPKPPATTILTGVITGSAGLLRRGCDLAKSTEYPFERVKVRHHPLQNLTATPRPEPAARIRREGLAYALHEQRHLIRHQAHLTIRRCEHGQAGTIADRHHQ